MAGPDDVPEQSVGGRRVRLTDVLAVTLTTIILGAWAAGWISTFEAWGTEGQRLGVDLGLYLDATREWAGGGSFYPERQLRGPYDIAGLGEILYPPTTLFLFLAFTILPAALWWVIPMGIIAAVIAYWRPAPYGWPVIALILWWPRTNQDLLTGNPAIWIAAAAALGTILSWPSVLVLLKPTLAPAALIGIRHRRWWVGLAALILVSLPLLPLWGDYIKVLLDARHPQGWLYSFSEIPMVLIGLAAWSASQRRRRMRPAGEPTEPTTPVGGS